MVESRFVRLSDLFTDVKGCRFVGSLGLSVNSLSYRSDRVLPGALFFCVPGFVRDGHDFAADAVERGALALCVERPLDLPVTQIVVPSVRMAMGPVAAVFYGRPSYRLLTAGVTGTNGKTTSAFLLAHLLDTAGLRSGLMSTVESRVGGVATPALRTTPEALDIQRDLAAMVEAGDRAVVMEVSSHALDLGRVLGVDFRAVAFTNLTQDHLDYHDTLEAYFEAKRTLFVDPAFARGNSTAVINIDDPYGSRLAADCPPDRILTFSSAPIASETEADLAMRDYVIDAGGTRGTLVARGRALRFIGFQSGGEAEARPQSKEELRFEISSRLLGVFNVANILNAFGLGLGLGLGMDHMVTALRDFRGVPGRMEPVEAGQEFAVLVDYAHTPDSVSNVLLTAREITKGRLIAVLGCGGDRDRTKRPHMGRQAELLADLVFVTSDNPRSEDPRAIIDDILAGVETPSAVAVQVDRREAIKAAINGAHPDDVVVILGKGHESGQEFAGYKIPFDDRLVAREVLEALLREAG
jgi:UDP-N-acetylmuramoyl-L-alanyl-D-glutamate--2,6-diaminopimelate ligase